MLTHRMTLPDGTEIEFFDNTAGSEWFNHLGLPTEQNRHFNAKNRRIKAVKKARKIARLARRKNR